MPVGVIVSYDGTTNDDDALALGQMLAGGAAHLSLAYVRHSHEYDPRREEIAQHDAQRRLEQGATWLSDPDDRASCGRRSVDRRGARPARRGGGRGADRVRLGLPDPAGAGRARGLGAAAAAGRLVAVAVAAAGLRATAHGGIRPISVVGSEDDAPRSRPQRPWRRRSGRRVSNGEDPAPT